MAKSQGAVSVRDFEKFYHFILNLKDDTTDNISDLLNIKINNPIENKKNLIKRCFQIYDEINYQKIFQTCEEKAYNLFNNNITTAEHIVYQPFNATDIVNLLVDSKLCTSKKEAKKAIKNNAIKINNQVDK